MNSTFCKSLFPALALVSYLSCAASPAWAEGTPPQHFSTPDEAAAALVKAAQSADPASLTNLFGQGHKDLLSSGDPVEDKNNRDGFAALAKEKILTDKTAGDKATVLVGNQGWPFPIPLVKQADGWQFDAAQGEQEIINRRIGRNELRTLSAVGAYREAQEGYASSDRDGDGVAEYAQKIVSTPGQQDGLFWETQPGEADSPLGPLMAEAQAQGYVLEGKPAQPTPYHGYYYRILTRQGPAAPGGKYDYVINGNMIAGFALVAFPASYGASGVMSFIINHQGRIFQKDLGPKTAETAKAMREFNPDQTWMPVVLSD